MNNKEIRLKLSDEGLKQLLELKQDSNAPSLAELIRKSISFYRFLRNKSKQGYEVIFKRKGKEEILIFDDF